MSPACPVDYAKCPAFGRRGGVKNFCGRGRLNPDGSCSKYASDLFFRWTCARLWSGTWAAWTSIGRGRFTIPGCPSFRTTCQFSSTFRKPIPNRNVHSAAGDARRTLRVPRCGHALAV